MNARRRWILSVAVMLQLTGPARPAPAQSPAGPPSGWLVPPVDGAIARHFDAPEGRFSAGHRGIDYATEPGALVRAAGDGRVTFAGLVAGARAVSIDHGGGLTSTYSSLSSTLVATTQLVRQGQWLGRAGVAHDDGSSGLHFGVKLDGDYVDPSAYLGPVAVAGAIHLAPLASAPPEIPTEDFPGTVAALRSLVECTPPAGMGDPVPPNGNIAVAIAGLTSQTRDGSLPDLYARGPRLLGYPRASIYRFSYEGARGPSLHERYDRTATYRDLRFAAQRLRDLLVRIARRAPGRKIDLIAHSQGGVIARLYLESLHRSWDPRLPVVEHLVTFATPHDGAPLAGAVGALVRDTWTGGMLLRWISRRAREGAIWPDPFSPAAAQLAPGSPLLESLQREDLAFGTRALAVGITNDVVVPADRAVLDGEISRVVGPSGVSGHSAILSAPEALATAHAFLRDAREPCPSGWNLWGPRVGAVTGWVEGRLPWLYGRAENALLRRWVPGPLVRALDRLKS